MTRQDGVAVFGAVIAALEKEAANLDRRAAAARALFSNYATMPASRPL